MTVIEALESLEAAAQGNARLEALEKADEACPDLRQVLFLALSPDVTFGIKKLPEPLKTVVHYQDDDQWLEHTKNLLDELRHRSLTGHDAQEVVAGHMGVCNENQLKWFTRILRQDLRLNIGAKDVNKTLGSQGEVVIPLFAVPLATDYVKVKPKDLKGRWVEQPKLDGGRCVAIIRVGQPKLPIRMLSRTGKEWGNFESIRRELEAFRQTLYEHGFRETFYLDGEVVSIVDGRIDFQSIQKTMMRKDGVEVGELHFYVFDMAAEHEWQDPKVGYITRLENASYMVAKYYKGTKIDSVQWHTVDDPTSETMLEACKKYVELRFEGAMYRRWDLPVANKRSKTLLKVKMFKDAEARITGAVELERGGVPAGTLGALDCLTDKDVPFQIGTGLDDKERARLWAMHLKGELAGNLTNYKYFELTNDGVPRLPVYRSLRSKDDVSTSKEEEDE